jgi:predicted transcriptional regulator of viral defense system
MQTMRDHIVARIDRLSAGKVFSAKDFLDIASRTTIDVTLASLTLDGKIRRVRRGLYDVPKINPALGGKLSPDNDEAARAIARRQRWKIVPEGAWAANLLGLSTQVPAKIVYLTDGPNSEVPIGRRSWSER